MPHKSKEARAQFQREHRAKVKKEWGDGEVYFVYYLPEEHYCGATIDPIRRMGEHRSSNHRKNTDNWKILYATRNEQEALRIEAEFHLMGIEGAAWKLSGLRNRKKKKRDGII